MTGAHPPIRILTWNLWWRFGPWEERRNAIRSVLDSANPDICAFQEVWASPQENLAERFADEFDMNWTWVASPRQKRLQRQINDPTITIGNAIISRWPIEKRAELHLPHGDLPDEGRTALFTLIDGPRQAIPFFTAHLNAHVAHSAIRCEQAGALARFVADHRAGSFPPVVAGDFNAEPDSDEIRLFEGYKTAPAVAGQVLMDAWRYTETIPGATWDHRNNPYVAARLTASARPDYVFIGPAGPDGAGHVQSIQIIGNEPVDGVWPSDHYALLAELHP